MNDQPYLIIVTGQSNSFLKPTVPEVEPLVARYYAKPGNAAGGNLHIVLDDGNYSNSSVEFCLARAEEAGDRDGVTLARLLLQMSKTQRKKLSTNGCKRGGVYL